MEFLRPRKPGEPSCRCKMRMSGLCKIEMSAFMVGRGRHGHGANRLGSTRTGPAMRATRSKAEADHADRSRQAAEGQRSSHTSAAVSTMFRNFTWIERRPRLGRKADSQARDFLALTQREREERAPPD